MCDHAFDDSCRFGFAPVVCEGRLGVIAFWTSGRVTVAWRRAPNPGRNQYCSISSGRPSQIGSAVFHVTTDPVTHTIDPIAVAPTQSFNKPTNANVAQGEL